MPTNEQLFDLLFPIMLIWKRGLYSESAKRKLQIEFKYVNHNKKSLMNLI